MRSNYYGMFLVEKTKLRNVVMADHNTDRSISFSSQYSMTNLIRNFNNIFLAFNIRLQIFS